MSKKCINCGAISPDEARFCQACGGSEFTFAEQSAPQNFTNDYQQQNMGGQYTSQQNTEPQYPENQYAGQQYTSASHGNPGNINIAWQPPAAPVKPKSIKGIIIGIVAAGVVVTVAIVLCIIGYLSKAKGKTSTELGYSSSASENSVEYTKGTFDGTTYINEWADIKFTLPAGFSDADSSTYMEAENSNTECGMYFIADDTMGLIYICYEKLPTFPVYDEEEYLDSAIKSLENISGITYKIPDTYSTATIGGYAYAKAECEFNNGIGDFANTFYVRKLDNYMIGISAIGVSAEYNDALIDNITTAR